MLTEEQLMQRAEQAKRLADELKARLDEETIPERKQDLLRDYWFYRGKLDAYREVIKAK